MIKCEDCGEMVAPEDLATHWTVHHTKVGEQSSVPDLIQEIVAYRAWQVVLLNGVVTLKSVTRTSHVWLPDEWTYADCTKKHADGVPAKGCTCGLYAAKDRNHLLSMSYHRYDESKTVVIGEVGLAGKVIPGTQGYRAEKARILKIEVPYERWQIVNPLKDRYPLVDVTLGVTLTKKES